MAPLRTSPRSLQGNPDDLARKTRMDLEDHQKTLEELAAIIAEIQRVPCAIGQSIPWYEETVPDLCFECDGASYLRASYPELFDEIGTMYGAADSTHFNVQDKRGLLERGWNHGKASGLYDQDASTRTKPTATGATITDGDHVGTEQNDTMQKITGYAGIDALTRQFDAVVTKQESGVFTWSANGSTRIVNSIAVGTATGRLNFNSANSTSPNAAKTSDYENHPKNVTVMYITRYAWS
mgnify:CR=1 FL=1